MLLLVATLLASSPVQPGTPPEPSSPRPVIVELFTSEGCSSCPPADEALAELWKHQPIAGAVVVPLAFHVDYWNRLGWTDPFSSPRFSDRQATYDSVLGTRIFTPHAMIGGRASRVGSDVDGIRAAVRAALDLPQVEIRVTRSPNGLRAEVDHSPPIQNALPSVWLAWLEEDLSSTVMSGENAGRTLKLAPVVRSLEKLGDVGANGRASFEIKRASNPDWRPEHLFPVVFVQRADTLEILGAGLIPPGLSKE